MTYRILYAAILALCIAPFAAANVDRFAPIAGDPHLPVLPRTEAERTRIQAAVDLATEFSAPQRFEENPAGAATVRITEGSGAFSLPSGNVSFEDELLFKVGNGIFRKIWVFSPASTLASDGLGPLYNARACQRCHIKDGRGHPPEDSDDNAISMVFALSIPDATTAVHAIEGTHRTVPDSVYGHQLQDRSAPGIAPEGQIAITYEEIEVPLAGGETAFLRSPTYEVAELGYGPLDPNVMTSPRVAPQMIGLGLLEAIPAATILEWADPDDLNDDGISGRPNIIWSMVYDQPMLGRFGLKAGQPTLLEQNATAFHNDIGISTPLHQAAFGDCTAAQVDCIDAPHGDGDPRIFEVDQEILELVTFYSANLGVPARRDVEDPEVLRGKELFYEANCVACHRPAYVTHRLEGDIAQSFQLIWPYTDMLLHDMGPGLADNRPEGVATGQEWRTPPLWGIGLTEQVSGHTYFLHDGRARNLLEAILWHGGEGQPSRDTVADMSPDDRAALIRFLESL